LIAVKPFEQQQAPQEEEADARQSGNDRPAHETSHTTLATSEFFETKFHIT
jgi:hypothetical protein